MRPAFNGEPGKDWYLAEGTYVFAGVPGDCLGEVTLVNCSDEKIRVRRLEARPPPRKRKGRQTLKGANLQLSARMRPGEVLRTEANFQVPPGTAPGQYDAVVPCGERKVRVEVTVFEHFALDVSPGHIRIQGQSGEAVSVPITITNEGNVPVALRDVGMVWLRERDWIGRTLVYALRETQESDTYEDFANRLLHDFRRAIVSPARIQLAPALDGPLAVGQCLTRTLEMTLPQGLQKGRLYMGFIKINETRIWLELYCDGRPVSPGKRAESTTRD